MHVQGRRNNFYLGVARMIRKIRFCEFLNFLLYKSPILGVARATLATPVPTPLVINAIQKIFGQRGENSENDFAGECCFLKIFDQKFLCCFW